MLTLFKLFEINGRGMKPAWKALEEKMHPNKSSGTIKKIGKTVLIVGVVAGGVVALRWAWKNSYGPRRELRKKRHELEALLEDILQEKIDGNLTPKLHQLKELFQKYWDDLASKKNNLGFWKEWLAELTDGDKVPSESANWNHGRKEKLMTDLESVHF